MKQLLFEYAVLLHEKNKEGEITNTLVIIEPKTILGKSEKDVVFKVTREIPDQHAKDPDNVEILIRNF
jgi:hypothetical protein